MPYKDKRKQIDYQNQWMKRRRSRILQKLGMDTCSECGSRENICVHHTDPEKKVAHRIWSWKETRILQELEKCKALCKVCHNRHHLAKEIVHGTASGYSHYGCRCADCTRSHRDRMREWTLKNKAKKYDHVWYWKSRLPERKGQRCRVLVRARAMNSILVEFEDGFKVVTSRFAVREAKEPIETQGTLF